MEGHHPHQYHHQSHPHPQQHHVGINVEPSDRFPQWSVQETKEFLTIRAELDQTFMETKRNKVLWEVISTRMKEKGFNRSADQCKCKWKNLVTRYKGCETMEPEAMRQQFPFYNELQAIFSERMQRMLWAEAEGTASGSGKKVATAALSDEDDDNDDSEGDKSGIVKRKSKKAKTSLSIGASGSSNGFRDVMEEFMRQQMQMEVQWREWFEARENDRKMKEMEWRQTMEALENERAIMERRWREREEQWRMREEARAEKRDALVNALLNKLRREGNI